MNTNLTEKQRGVRIIVFDASSCLGLLIRSKSVRGHRL